MSEWREVSLGSVTEWTSGGTPRKNEPSYWNGDIPWISAVSMKKTRLYDSEMNITSQGLENGSRLAEKGSILLLVRGSELHKRIPIGMAMKPLAFNQDVKSLKALDGLLPEYLLYWLLGNEKLILTKVEHTGIGAGKLDTNVMKNLCLNLPSLPEQREIVSIISKLDDKIELNRRMSETLETMAKTIFKSWFVDFDPVRAKAEGLDLGLPEEIAELFPDRFEETELGEVPKGWNLCCIGDLAEVVGGSTPSTKEPTYWDGGIYYWATPKDLSSLSIPVLLNTERLITDAGLSKISSGLLPKGTVLLSSRAPIGYLAVAEVPVAINQGFIAMKPKKTVSNLFILLWASSAHEDILSRANGSTFLEISKSNFRPIPVITPTADVMVTFDKFVRPLYDKIVKCERESQNLTELRDTLLPMLISGELHQKVAEKIFSKVSL